MKKAISHTFAHSNYFSWSRILLLLSLSVFLVRCVVQRDSIQNVFYHVQIPRLKICPKKDVIIRKRHQHIDKHQVKDGTDIKIATTREKRKRQSVWWWPISVASTLDAVYVCIKKKKRIIKYTKNPTNGVLRGLPPTPPPPPIPWPSIFAVKRNCGHISASTCCVYGCECDLE